MVLFLICWFSSANVFAADETPVVPSLEQLLNKEVQIASKHGESWQTTEAAVLVLTHNVIVRFGARTIPDCLRSVSELHGAKTNSGTWVVIARESEGRFTDFPLVTGNGRVVYNHLFGGVDRDIQDLLRDDVDEVPQHISLRAFEIGVALNQGGDIHGRPFLSPQPQQGVVR